MPATKSLAVKKLSLDLCNYRTVPQPSEIVAIETMISMSPDRFWALTESLLQDGYLPTETIIVLRGVGRPQDLIVKEGNRRVAALKLIHGVLPLDGLDVPANVLTDVSSISGQWLLDNSEVPCTIYEPQDAPTVDRIVTLTHGKGQKAGRDQWNAVARARHSRDRNSASEPALDLLEKYLHSSRHVTRHQRASWTGSFPLTVLAEAMKRLAARFGAGSAAELASLYPNVTHRGALERIIHDVGIETLRFEGIRGTAPDFGVLYGLPPLSEETNRKPKRARGGNATSKSTSHEKPGTGTSDRALPTQDPRTVKRFLRKLSLSSHGREKLEALRQEALALSIPKTPLAFCFVLRSMFELSAKAYCADHKSRGGPSTRKTNGEDRPLVDVLRDITRHLTDNDADKEAMRRLHGAITDLARPESLLSVTSMNQLVHNPQFSVTAQDIAVTFSNVFPLLDEMNNWTTIR